MAAMRKRVVGFLLIGGLLAGCGGNSATCDDDAGPETVTVDASYYAEEGSDLLVCMWEVLGESGWCNSPGGDYLGVTFVGMHGKEQRYDVTRINDDGRTRIAAGTHQLSCDQSETLIEVGQ